MRAVTYTYTAPDRNHMLLADLYGGSDDNAANIHRSAAQALRAGILDLFWDPAKVCVFLETLPR